MDELGCVEQVHKMCVKAEARGFLFDISFVALQQNESGNVKEKKFFYLFLPIIAMTNG